MGSAQGLTEAFKEKMTMPTDVVQHKLAEARGGAGGRKGMAPPTAHDEDDDVMTRVKAADQMTGTAFNDVGKMGEEGTGTGMKTALRAGADEDDDVMLRVKAADHMTGQAFNDVGKMGEEGTGMPWASRTRAAGNDA